MSTAKYQRLNSVGRERYNERADCGVIAVALVCDVSYGKAQAELRRQGRKDRCGTATMDILHAAEALGFSTTLAGVADKPTVMSVAPAVKGRALLFTTDHVLAVIDGIVHDFIGQRSRRRVIGISSITEAVA